MIGFIFDLDGVLTDTSEFHYLAWKRLADEEGIPFTRQDNEALRGVPRRLSLEILLKGLPCSESKMQSLMQRKNEYYLSYVDQITEDNLFVGVRCLLEEIKSNSFKIGLASASRNARLVSQKLGICDFFDAFGDGTSIYNPKPAPDIFLWVAGGLNIPVTRCIVFEDAMVGIEGALKGGFHTVGIGSLTRLSGAHYLRENLQSSSVAEFLTHFNLQSI
ncbi:beta-phosphoglucomutase [Anaerolineales bacterium]